MLQRQPQIQEPYRHSISRCSVTLNLEAGVLSYFDSNDPSL